MPEVEAHTDTAPPRIGFVAQHETFLSKIDRVECHGLTDEDAETIKRELMSRNPWRLRFGNDAFYAELPPLVVADRIKFAFPPPCTVHFEPTPLRDTDRTLQDLADHIREAADPSLHKLLDRKPTLSRFVRAKVTYSTALVLFFLVMDGRDWLSGVPFRFAMGLFAIRVFGELVRLVSTYFAERRDWYLVPGAVVVRDASESGPADLRVYSPKETNIHISGSSVSLRDRKTNRGVRATCTPLEIAVLLAVWQSPIPAPDVSKLVDLQ